MDDRPDMQASYDRVAASYADRFEHELDYKPFDRELLDRFVPMVRGHGPVCDLGCGPGHVAAYLHRRGVEMLGLDLSPGMVAEARHRHSDIPFEQGDMRALAAADGAWAGIVAFYSLIHIARPELPAALTELHRVLRPGGLLLVAFHVGDETLHLDTWWDQPVAVDFHFFGCHEMIGYLKDAGFELLEEHERPPYEQEHPTERCYLLVRKPATG